MTWHPCADALPAPDADALVLTDAGDVVRARVQWTGRAWRWHYWNKDAAIGADVTHWTALVLPGDSAAAVSDASA